MRSRGLTMLDVIVASLVIVITAGIVYPLIPKVTRTHCPASTELSSMKQLSLSVAAYTCDYDDVAPFSTDWLQAMKAYGAKKEFCRCLGIHNSTLNNQFGHAMHKDMLGINMVQIADPGRAAMFFDSKDLWEGAVSDLTRLPTAGRAQGKLGIGFADCHVAFISVGTTVLSPRVP